MWNILNDGVGDIMSESSVVLACENDHDDAVRSLRNRATRWQAVVVCDRE